ncbi:MAG: protein kinase [Elusimicrobia bacterium]|nr:protein kinase [Elusimicrobiota bacterium]
MTQGENKGKNEKESDDDGKVAETQSVDPAATKTPAAKKQDPNKKANEIAAPGIDGSHSVDEMERERELMRLRGLKKNFHMKKVEGEASSEVGGTSLPIPAPNKADTPDSGPAYHEGMVQVPGMGNPGASGSQQFSVAEGYLRDASEKNMMSDFQGSLRSAKEVIARDKSNWKAHNFMAVAYNRLADGKGLSREQRMANYQQAEWSALEALRCKLDYAPAYESLAWAQLKLGKYKDAVASASNAIKYNPKSAIGYAVRAYANEMLGRRDDMLADIEAAARLNPVLFDEALRKAKRGERIYDPNEDSWQLLQSVAKGRMGALPWPVAAGLLAGLAALALCGALAWKKFSPQLRPKSERMKAELSSAVLQKDAAAEEAAGRLAGKYQLARIIGKGGMGEVWEAKDISLDRIVAVKKMVIAGNFEAKAREMYLKEARTLAALHHPNIVDIYEVIDLPSGLYLVFELLAGKTVQQILAESKRIRLAQAKEILKPVCDALEFAHASSVVHRDLKPSNIMVTEQGYIKVMDFGIARRIQDGGPQGPVPAGALLSINPAPGGNGGSAPAFLTSFARTQTIAGTPAYMAPEAESGLVTPTLDVYALGVCLYEMLTGELPFSQHEVARKMERAYVKASARVPGVPRQIDALIDSALDPDIATRMKTAKEFQQALEAVPVQA